MKKNLNVVGESVLRNDVVEKVLGTAKYIDDYKFDGMLYGFTVRSTISHGKIISINISKAKKINGVVNIFTAKDIPGKNFFPMILNDYPFLAENKVLFYGQPIALVVATNQEIAKEAAKNVFIEYEELEPVLDIHYAMKKNSPKIFGSDNILRKYIIKKGNIDQGFKEADVIVEDVFETNYQVHSYLEPNGMIAVPQPDGGITVYGTMQCPFYVHDAIANILNIYHNKIRVVQTTTGGGFGGKEDVPSLVAGHVALLAYLTKKPVKLVYTREEDFHGMSKRHPGYIEIKYGAKKNGKIVAAKVRYILDGGAFATLSPIVLWRGTVHAVGPYDIPNVLIESFAVATNKVPCGAFRGFGQPQATFANESLIDILAEKLKISPLKLRQINMLKPYSRTATNDKISNSCGFKKVLSEVIKKSKYEKILSKKNENLSTIKTGAGLAIAFYGVGLGAGGKYIDRAGAYLQIQKDGTVIISIGNTELGQGVFTVISQIASEILGAPYEFVKVLQPDTTRVPDSGPTVASRSTLMSGNAVLDAAKQVRERIDTMVLKLFNKSKGKVYSNGKEYFISTNPEKKIHYLEVIKKCFVQRINLSATGWYTGEDVSFDSETGQGKAYYSYTFSATVAIVKVNILTGVVEVKKIVSGHDIGKAINPKLCEAQIEGGVIQSLGYALTENLVLKNGIILNPSFAGYLIPTSMDIPEIIPVIVESKYSKGPFGAKGLGESPMITPSTAIANAIYNATGFRTKKLPVTPEILLELKNKK